MVARRPPRHPPATPAPPPEGVAEVIPLAGLPLAGERAAAILGLKLTGQWHRHSASTLAAQWGAKTDLVYQLAIQVDETLEKLTGKEPSRKLVLHQLLLALSEVDQISDLPKRVAARVKVAAEIAKVTGLVTKGFPFPGQGEPPPPLTKEALGAGG